MKGVIIKGSDISGMKVWFIPPGKPPGLAEGITEDKGNLKEDGAVLVTDQGTPVVMGALVLPTNLPLPHF